MPPVPKIGSPRPLGDLLLASGSRFQRYRWIVFAAAVALEVIVIWVVHRADSAIYPLDPDGAGIVFVSVLVAGLGGTLLGLATALVGVIASFLLLADFGTSAAAANAIASAIIWCGAAVITGLVVSYLRRQVARREVALQQALGRSLQAREQMERVLDFSPQFYQSGGPDAVAAAICEAAVETFGADGTRLYAIKGDSMEIQALTPPSETIAPGFALKLSDFPDLVEALAGHRPSFVRDARSMDLEGPVVELRDTLGIVSTVRIPIAGLTGSVGLLALSWTHPIERPGDDLLAIMQRFADQAAIAWQNALRAEAQRRADDLYETLERLVVLAPTFHITGTPEELAQAVCEAALSTFGCTGAALYRVEGDRLSVLDRRPPVETLSVGRSFPLSGDMPLAHELLSPTPTFVPDVSDPSRSVRPWPPEVIRQGGAHSVLYVPCRFEEHGPRNLLVLSWDRPRERPDPGFLVIVERFADQVALALSNASAEQLHARLEASLLPSTPIEHPLFSVVTRYRTGEQRLRLGGDFVGSTPVGDGGLHFIIGDVSGHGPDAAALGATLRSTWKALVLAEVSIPETVDVMRKVLLAEKAESGIFATIIAGCIDAEKRRVSLVNAGHLPPLLIADGLVSPLEADPASPLGFDGGAPWSLRHFPLPAHWSLFLYTDGLIEVRVAPGSSQRYGEARLTERLGAWTGRPPDDEAIDALMSEIETASGDRFADDVAILLVSTKDGAGGR